MSSDKSSPAGRRNSGSAAPLDAAFAHEDRAEKGLLASVENRRSLGHTPSGDSWHASVNGERPPLGTSVPFEKVYSAMSTSNTQQQTDDEHSASQGSKKERPKLADIARKVRLMNQAAKQVNNNNNSARHSHKRTASRAHAILESIQEDTTEESTMASQSRQRQNNIFEGVMGGDAPDLGKSQLAVEDSATDRLIAGAMQVEQLFQDIDADNASITSEVESIGMEMSTTSETLPLRENSSLYGSFSKTTNEAARRVKDRRKKQRKWLRMRRKFREYCHPYTWIKAIWFVICNSYFITLSVPAFVAAWIFYYHFGNPPAYFLPGNVTLAWWLNFFGRQCLMLESARIAQYLIIDKIVLGMRMAVGLLGPLLTLFIIQARGWPFLISSWGVLDMMLLHGRKEFQRHWLFWTDISLYSDANSGNHILKSDIYLRLLWGMLLAGWATAAKRTAVAMYFGQRTYGEFKPRLEKILKDIVLLSEASELAEEAFVMKEDANERASGHHQKRTKEVQFLAGDVEWKTSDLSRSRTVSEELTDDDEDDEEGSEMKVSSSEAVKEFSSSEGLLRRNSTGSLRAKDLGLDKWEEPVNKLDKTTNASIHDILNFRRALTFMDDDFPFGEHFGPAASREEVVKSAQVVYGRLLSLTPDCDGSLPYDVFDLLALEEDGTTTNMAKKKALRKLFRPDAKHELPFLDFLQSCDSLYKRLRFFRASVGNASVIDHVLESIIDGIFHFILALGLLSVMRFNPWPLLVSMSTLLVSISFAVGSSASKYIEGILLIAFRRPYDLGDRIYMTDPSQVNVDYNYCSSWFIEDINLFYTTVRYAGTNEVATVNNGAISNMRIINGNRSPSAMVWFQLPFHISILDGNKLDKLKAALEKYAQDHPRSWHSFAYCRVDKYHVEIEQVVITIGFQHRSAWQDLTRILFAKSDLVAYTWRVAKNLDVCYEELPKRDLLYYAGELKDVGEKDYRRDLHHRDNIASQPKGVASDQTAVSNDSANAMFLSQLRKSHM